MSKIVKQQLGEEINDLPGAGAAGGLAAGAVAFMNADIVSGADKIIEFTDLKQKIQDADWVITGEGEFDSQSLNGKVVSGVAEEASKTNCKVAVIAGTIDVPKEIYEKYSIRQAIACKKEGMSLEYALKNAEELLVSAVTELVKYIQSC